MAEKHTPGPLEINPPQPERIPTSVASKHYRIFSKRFGRIAYVAVPPGHEAEALANARLFAGAAQLLETLTRIAKLTDVGAETITPVYIKALRDLARAAIAEAAP